MSKVVLLVIVCAGTMARAEEVCTDLCNPPPAAQMDPQVRDELLTGLGLFAAGYTVGVFAQLGVPLSTWERAVSTVPVFGAIEAATRSGENWEVRMTLVFSAGVQIVGALLAATSWVTHSREERAKKVTFSGNGVGFRF